jgi:hypothetical protein
MYRILLKLMLIANDKLKLTFIGKFKSYGLVGPKSVPV